jgi:two-component system, OmpR family, response regulator MprA
VGAMDPAPARVLIVDDEPAVRESLTSSLEFEGYQVRAAADGMAALEQVAGPSRTWWCWTC